jgi:ubiquinone/menaquinone biosynthesis C-methylase UbiE
MDNTHFDQAAPHWDENPTRLALTRAIAAAVAANVPLAPDWTALEYGCGTAALSLLLADRLGRIVAADRSPGMLAEVRRKIAVARVGNLTIWNLDLLARAQVPKERFDLILCAMAMHHVADVHRLLRAFAALLRPGGWLALADLQREDGSFHGGERVPHHGFDPPALGATLAKAGLANPAWRDVHILRRGERDYPVFLLTAQRPERRQRPAEPAAAAGA